MVLIEAQASRLQNAEIISAKTSMPGRATLQLPAYSAGNFQQHNELNMRGQECPLSERKMRELPRTYALRLRQRVRGGCLASGLAEFPPPLQKENQCQES